MKNECVIHVEVGGFSTQCGQCVVRIYWLAVAASFINGLHCIQSFSLN